METETPAAAEPRQPQVKLEHRRVWRGLDRSVRQAEHFRFTDGENTIDVAVVVMNNGMCHIGTGRVHEGLDQFRRSTGHTVALGTALGRARRKELGYAHGTTKHGPHGSIVKFTPDPEPIQLLCFDDLEGSTKRQLRDTIRQLLLLNWDTIPSLPHGSKWRKVRRRALQEASRKATRGASNDESSSAVR